MTDETKQEWAATVGLVAAVLVILLAFLTASLSINYCLSCLS